MTADPALALRGLRKAYASQHGRVHVLDGLDLTVGHGEVVALCGPSGCGKSTLLRIAAGLERIDGGEARSFGEPVAGPSVRRGVVFQQYSLFPWLSVERNVAFGLRHGRRLGQREAQEQVAAWLDRVGLASFARFYPGELSGGMQQRVALARTLITEPDLLLLDEPFAALDAVTRGTLHALFSELMTSGRSALFITHDPVEAAYLADRVVVLTEIPATVAAVVDVPFERPRDRDLLFDPAFTHTVETVDRCLRRWMQIPDGQTEDVPRP